MRYSCALLFLCLTACAPDPETSTPSLDADVQSLAWEPLHLVYFSIGPGVTSDCRVMGSTCEVNDVIIGETSDCLGVYVIRPRGAPGERTYAEKVKVLMPGSGLRYEPFSLWVEHRRALLAESAELKARAAPAEKRQAAEKVQEEERLQAYVDSLIGEAKLATGRKDFEVSDILLKHANKVLLGPLATAIAEAKAATKKATATQDAARVYAAAAQLHPEVHVETGSIRITDWPPQATCDEGEECGEAERLRPLSVWALAIYRARN